jgi:hypothetical protein
MRLLWLLETPVLIISLCDYILIESIAACLLPVSPLSSHTTFVLLRLAASWIAGGWEEGCELGLVWSVNTVVWR